MAARRETTHPIDPLFTNRWSPRAFTDDSIDAATLLSFFAAARWAPSSFNAQPWRFIYGRRGTPGWTPIFDSLLEFNQAWAHRAVALVLVRSKTRWVPPGKTEMAPFPTHSFDTGAAWASLAFQATLAGWHVHGMGGFDRDKVRASLAIPEDIAIEAVVAIGRSGDKAMLSQALQDREMPNQRLPLPAIVADGRFSFKD